MLSNFFDKLFSQKNNFEWSLWGQCLWRIKFFSKILKKKLYQALKYFVPVVCCSNSGLFSNKEVFFHIDFILIRMCPDVLFLWQKISNEFYWRFFFTNFFDKKIILNGHLEVYAYGESNFFLKFQKNFRSGLKKHCSGCFLKQPGSFFIQASILSHRFHTQ